MPSLGDEYVGVASASFSLPQPAPGTQASASIRPSWPWPLRYSFDRYSGALACLAVRVLGTDTCAVDELIEALFLRLHRRPPRLSGPQELRNWLMRQALSRLTTELRWRHLARACGRPAPVTYFNPLPAGTSAERRELVACLYTWLDTLPARARIAWLLHFVQEQSVAEIGALCGCSVVEAQRRVAWAEARRGQRPYAMPAAVVPVLLQRVGARWTAQRRDDSWQCLRDYLARPRWLLARA